MEYTIIAIAANKWGKDSTIEKARKAGKINSRDHYVVYFSSDPTAYVDDMGSFTVKARNPMPFKIGEFNKPNDNKKVEKCEDCGAEAHLDDNDVYECFDCHTVWDK